ncbi:uncharacterized protein HKW66_Vig0153440 [Vigna angularis]|uniref:Uncharacterized protein n=1 Tax=Phaseolus angularis TaxID=3914 RepID=A0A8T0JNJ1_PHAAN|nr:uncharacterized protein HKW66_Vig0153440 [Vigna angularis]
MEDDNNYSLVVGGVFARDCVRRSCRRRSWWLTVARSGEYYGKIARPFGAQGKPSSSSSSYSSSSLFWVVSQGSVDTTSSKRNGHDRGVSARIRFQTTLRQGFRFEASSW